MPFTFSHPAIVLPLSFLPKRVISITGLVLGSIAPDFEYFVRMKVQSEYSHTIGGLFWFDLPMGILLTFIFHNVVRDPLFNNLPEFLRSRFAGYKKLNWNEHFAKFWLAVIFSIIIGASSHLFWDGFTHQHGFFVEKFKSLANQIFLFDRTIPIFKILQHASTLIGGVVILVVIHKLPKLKTDDSVNPITYWGLAFIIFSMIIIVRFLFGLTIHEYGNIIVSCITAFLGALVLTPLIMRKHRL